MVLGRLGNRETVMAEREGFEPSIRLPVCRISSAVHSTTLPPLRQKVAKRLVLIMPRVWLDWSLRSEEHTSELQSLMRISYAVFCLKKKKNKTTIILKHIR